jgi:hypothetical protein
LEELLRLEELPLQVLQVLRRPSRVVERPW